MIVATAALERLRQERGAEGVDAVRHIRDAKLFFDDAALFVLHVQTVERGRQPLVFRGVRQHVAGQLPRCEFVVRLVAVEGTNHPVAEGPHLAEAVRLVAVRVGVPCEVEPLDRHPFAVARRRQQAIDDGFVRGCGNIRFKGIDFGQSRRQASEVERRAAQPGFFRRFGRKGESFADVPCRNERVDRVALGTFGNRNRTR